jgi:hypothetical protein
VKTYLLGEKTCPEFSYYLDRKFFQVGNIKKEHFVAKLVWLLRGGNFLSGDILSSFYCRFLA